jgi:2,3-bisphosphoglycerate-independent phosphoglycerate mutase
MKSGIRHKILFVFLDGIGLARPSPANPFGAAHTPFLHSLLGGPLCRGGGVRTGRCLLSGIDACLGVKGIPQSATGQTALLTGMNAAAILGFHLPAFPNQKLVSVIQEHNLLSRALAAGARPMFANSYSPLYFRLVAERKRRHSVTTHCMLAAGLTFRNMDDLRRNRAVHWDMTRESLAVYEQHPVPVISYYQAGTHLAGMTADFDLVLYESFLSDLIGHSKSMEKALVFLEHLDEFFKGVFDHLDRDVTLVVASDHGNLEDISTTQHTRNPVPLLVCGSAVEAFIEIDSILGITPAIIDVLKMDGAG